MMTNPTCVGKQACCLEKRTVSVSSPLQQLGLQALPQQSHDKAATLPAQEAKLVASTQPEVKAEWLMLSSHCLPHRSARSEQSPVQCGTHMPSSPTHEATGTELATALSVLTNGIETHECGPKLQPHKSGEALDHLDQTLFFFYRLSSSSSSSHCSTPHQVRGWGNAPSRMSVRATEPKQDPAIEGAQGGVDGKNTLEPRAHKVSRT